MCPIRSLGSHSHESLSCARLSRREQGLAPWLGTTLLFFWEQEHPSLAWWAGARVAGAIRCLAPLLPHGDMPVVLVIDGLAAQKLGENPGRLPYVVGPVHGALVPAYLYMIVLVVPQVVYRFPDQHGLVSSATLCAILRQNQHGRTMCEDLRRNGGRTGRCHGCGSRWRRGRTRRLSRRGDPRGWGFLFRRQSSGRWRRGRSGGLRE
jgi:hypothetical protein